MAQNLDLQKPEDSVSPKKGQFGKLQSPETIQNAVVNETMTRQKRDQAQDGLGNGTFECFLATKSGKI